MLKPLPCKFARRTCSCQAMPPLFVDDWQSYTLEKHTHNCWAWSFCCSSVSLFTTLRYLLPRLEAARRLEAIAKRLEAIATSNSCLLLNPRLGTRGKSPRCPSCMPRGLVVFPAPFEERASTNQQRRPYKGKSQNASHMLASLDSSSQSAGKSSKVAILHHQPNHHTCFVLLALLWYLWHQRAQRHVWPCWPR